MLAISSSTERTRPGGLHKPYAATFLLVLFGPALVDVAE
jgi:hypothetical protein